MAAALGAVKQGVAAVNDALNGVMDQVTLPEGEWIEPGAVCDAPCMISGLPLICGCSCSCITVYMTWSKIMKEEATKMAGFVVLGNCLGWLLGLVLYYIGAMFLQTGLFGICIPILILVGQTIGLVNQRKKLGQWMNIPEEKLAGGGDMACECLCCCFIQSAEARSVEDWTSKTMLVEAPLKAAHEAKKQMDAAAGAVTQP